MRKASPFGLTIEEALGLLIALGAHVALIVALTMSPLGRSVEPPPQRMTVSLSDALADQSTSPKPDAQPAPDVAPALGEPDQADQADQPIPVPVPKPVVQPAPKPLPKPEPLPVPKPVIKPKPAIKPKPEPKPEPAPRPVTKVKAEPHEKPADTAPATPKTKADARPKPDTKAAADSHAHPHADKPVGGSKIDSNFLRGITGATSPGTDKVSPADKAAPISAADVKSAISRQIKPHWTAPQGVDAEKLVTVIAFTLNPDGSLSGRPELVSQSGITDANRAQAQRHIELAMRAVQLAAPFKLSPQVYVQFRRFQARFDRALSQ